MTKRTREEVLERAKAALALKVETPHRPEPGSDEEVEMFLREALAEAKATCRQYCPDQTS